MSSPLPPDAKVSGYYTQLTMNQLAIGATAPDFELQGHRLNDALRTGPVALVFYKASCPTCQFTFPYIQRIFASGTGKTLWAISEDDAAETRAFIEQHGLTFDVLIEDHPYPVSAAYALEYVPAMFIVEPDGTISMSDYGFSKAALNTIAGFEFFKANDGLPATRPG